MSTQKIAVIGSGISGLSAAWLLSKRHQVTLYEAGSHLGGHANTVDVDTLDGRIAVDTGFIVYNERNYPNLVALFRHLGVASCETQMSFALSLQDGAYEYAGAGLGGFFGQRRNLARASHWRLLRDISRFFETAQKKVAACPPDMTLGAFLTREDYSQTFVDDHIVPMGAAIWSTSMTEMLDFPARSFVDFYANHGMLQFKDRPNWRTVTGGSRNYVHRLVQDGDFEICHDNAIKRVVRHPGYVHIVDAQGAIRPFDHVVMATHADQALAMIEAPTPREERLLGSFSYQANRAVLHRDPRWMPRRKRLWSSWNYLKRDEGAESELCVTYWMNRLQGLPSHTNLFVTLNPYDEIHPKATEREFLYEHPVFDRSAMAAQKDLWALQGERRTWFCGSYFGYGFHEDGIQSGLAVAEELGGVRRPWQVADASARIAALRPVAIEAAE
ncbi:putative NAD/FAD-binding protein [Breoghania corrubedonensis]|uniref:Putative NAD/FAD-binding protein n=1 Tax=Breoghania corrubedonensis TaxID=665038 RepID=A0A2T5US42_9HYPH|nr:FAD-dependent oxidoreductase [Breoghania corrubedonensis]PTW54329.1 putative NAD/FAD-binding protein [Breoghania corrubedonensis]